MSAPREIDQTAGGKAQPASKTMQGIVLIVDDENGPRQALRMLLKEDYQVLMASDVPSAKAVLESQPVDLVVTDIRMPNQTGVDLLRYVRAQHPDYEVIILTGYGQLNTAMEAVKLGAYAYIEKPYDNDVMLDHVAGAIAKRRREQERQQMERLALEANRFELLGRVVSGLIHDLATPLSVAGSHLELMLLDNASEQSVHRLNLILSQVSLCSDVIRSTLSFLRHRTHQRVDVNLSELADSCLELSYPILRKQSIQVIKEYQEELPQNVGDFILVRQAVLNLINNACQAMEGQEEPQELTVRTWSEEGMVCLSVRDTGKGIAASDRSLVFDTFYTTKGDQGTGLGLAAVRNIMRGHGGDVDLGEHEGRGALFVLRFPLEAPEDRQPPSED